MTHWRRVATALAATLALASLAGSAWAQFRPKIACEKSGNTGSIVINGKQAVSFQAANGNIGPLDRAQITTDRLAAMVQQQMDPATIRVEGDKHSARIYAADKLICIATAQDARLYRTSVLDLANAWASKVRDLLLMPPVIIEPREVTVPLGETRPVEVSGAAVGPVYAKIDDAQIADVAPEAATKRLIVSAKKLGVAQVDVSVEGQHATLVVYVKKYAGSLRGVVGQVTGNPCPASLVCYSARQAVAQNASLEPGAELAIGKVDCPSGALGPGKSRQIKVDVRMSGYGLIPVSTKASIEVRNVVLPREQPAVLFYSNDPESITKYQTLFAGKLEINQPTRLLYHHQNAMGRRAQVIVELVNPNESPAKVRIFRGVSPPSVDTIIVGHIAACAFMKDCANDVSVVETIPPLSRLVLVSDMLGNKGTSSGIIQVKQMEGQTAYVRVTAAEPNVDNVSYGSIARAPNPFVLQMSDQVYPSPVKQLDAEYVVGSRWAFIPIGKHALNDTTKQKQLYGNYGVTYNINVRISNPTDQDKKISFVFDPTAGPASAVFIIDGKFAPVKYAQPPNEITLSTVTLKPGETKKCRVETVPLAGSNYPATLIVKS